MKRAYNNSVNITSAHGATVQGYSEGDPAVPTPPTQVNADLLNNLQEELMNILDAGGVAPNGTYGQVLTALQACVLTFSKAITFQGAASQVVFGAVCAAPPDFQAGAFFEDTVWTTKDNASPGIANEITGRAVHKVHAAITLNTSTSPTVNSQDKWNVGSVTANSALKTITVPFARAFAAGVTPAVTFGISSLSGAPLLVGIGTISNNSVTFQIFNAAGVALDPTAAPQNGVLICVNAEGKQ